MEDTLTQEQLETAVRTYLKHKEICRQYNRTHREQIYKSNNAYYERLKQDPERYRKFLDKKKENKAKNRRLKKESENAPTNEEMKE